MVPKKNFQVIVVLVIVNLAFGCASQGKAAEAEKTINGNFPFRSEPAGVRGVWINNPTCQDKQDNMFSFTGLSLRTVRESISRSQAEADGRLKLASYFGEAILYKARAHAANYGLSSDVFDPENIGQGLVNRLTSELVQALQPVAYQTDFYLDNSGEVSVQVYAWMRIDRDRVLRTLENFSKDKSQELLEKAAREKTEQLRRQTLKAAEFFGGNLESSFDL